VIYDSNRIVAFTSDRQQRSSVELKLCAANELHVTAGPVCLRNAGRAAASLSRIIESPSVSGNQVNAIGVFLTPQPFHSSLKGHFKD
jgi:hypothetical protein